MRVYYVMCVNIYACLLSSLCVCVSLPVCMEPWMCMSVPPPPLPGFYFTQSFLTAVLQSHARSAGVPIDSLSFSFSVNTMTSSAPVGVRVHGLFLEGCRWEEEGVLGEQALGQLHAPLPPVTMTPVVAGGGAGHTYDAPVYMTSARKGTLSTTVRGAVGRGACFLLLCVCVSVALLFFTHLFV
ncbi:MAG: hypothetical protein P4L40_15045 [Terracidiphilus sp.]|nr:hypothetical protein [Terracidiphilus sp.]